LGCRRGCGRFDGWAGRGFLGGGGLGGGIGGGGGALLVLCWFCGELCVLGVGGGGWLVVGDIMELLSVNLSCCRVQ